MIMQQYRLVSGLGIDFGIVWDTQRPEAVRGNARSSHQRLGLSLRSTPHYAENKQINGLDVYIMGDRASPARTEH